MSSEGFEQSDITIDAVVRNLLPGSFPTKSDQERQKSNGERLSPFVTSYPMSVSEWTQR